MGYRNSIVLIVTIGV